MNTNFLNVYKIRAHVPQRLWSRYIHLYFTQRDGDGERMTKHDFVHVFKFPLSANYAVTLYPFLRPSDQQVDTVPFESLPGWIQHAVAMLELVPPLALVPGVGYWYHTEPGKLPTYVLPVSMEDWDE